MFIIRREQIKSLLCSFAAKLPERMFDALHETFPTRFSVNNRAEITAAVRIHIEGASRFGLMQERDLFLFVALKLLLEPDFENEPWAHRLLTDVSLDSSARIQNVYSEAVLRALSSALAGKAKEEIK